MIGRRLLALAALPAAAAIGLTGCQFSSSDAAPTGGTTTTVASDSDRGSTSPTPNVVTSAVKGSTKDTKKSFAVVIPDGWKNKTSSHKKTVMFLQSKTPSSGFYPTFNVIRQAPKTLPDLDDVVQQAKLAMRQKGSKVHNVAARTIGGEPAKGYVITRSANGQKIVQTQYFVMHDEAVYTTTMTSDDTASSKADQTQDAILSTWSWSTR